MRTITIFKQVEVDGKPTNQTLRIVKPGNTFVGYGKSGQPLHNEIMKLCQDLEPQCTGYSLN